MLAQLGAVADRVLGDGRVVLRPGDAPDPRPLPRPRPRPRTGGSGASAGPEPRDDRATPDDQVPGVEATAGAGTGRAGRRVGGADRPRPVLRHHPGVPGVQGPRARDDGGRLDPVRPRAGPVLRGHRPRRRPRVPRRGGRGRRPAERRARRARLRDRDLLHRRPLLPTRQRRPHRRRPRRDRGRVRRQPAVAGAPHQPPRGGRPGRLDDRPPDGLPEAVGATGRPPARTCGSPTSWPGRAGRSGATPGPWWGRRPCPTSTWPTSTRPTTSTATTRTTTCGRPWWRGTPPTTTAWPASGPSCGTRPPAAPSTGGAPCRRPWPTWSPGWRPRWSSCPTTTSRG